MTIYYWLTFNSEFDAQSAVDQINSNCGFPNACGTYQWDTVHQAYQQDLWFIGNPSENGYSQPCGSFTYGQMMAGVENYTLANSDPSWWAPDED